ncbi:MAG: outer membrane lipoprotein chaperone LolA [Gammaproteobacteria bacterium]|nr:outer membrane lipoprotein chaperone LolA [Gammaproteobacteria bacterium]MCH9763463.1 outer membrane lipoprotein chaperone LolA [Gammaproteobacteria bacterium]
MKKIGLGLLVWSMATGACSAAPGDVLWDKLSAIRSMQASFTQKVLTKNRELSNSSGTMALERPKHFRWQTKSPMEQLLVADGEKFWLYDVDLEQVTVRSQAELEGAAAGLFLGEDRARFFHDFHVTETQQNKLDEFILEATEKQANIQRMMLQFDDTQLVRMDLYDQLGQKTIIRFQQVKNNDALPSTLFRFTPPAGVDVVDQ